MFVVNCTFENGTVKSKAYKSLKCAKKFAGKMECGVTIYKISGEKNELIFSNF